jgi:hypothetical protein
VRSLVICILSICFAVQCSAQPLRCGTKVSKAALKIIQENLVSEKESVIFSEDTFYIPIKAFVVVNTQGQMVVDSAQIINEIDSANTFFKYAKIQFELCELILINNLNLAIFNSPEEEEIISGYGEDNRVINLYYVQELYLENVRVCGFAYFPPGQNRVFIDAACANLANTLTHELGHYFGLLHTHGLSNVNRSLELVDKSNCESTGDYICDTPADPYLIDKVDNNCNYTGDEKDWRLDPYDPMTNNIMSYTNFNCPDSLTPGQYRFIRNALFKFNRTDYSCSKSNESFPVTSIKSISPNPVYHDFLVEIELDGEQTIDLSIFDFKGAKIYTIYNGILQKGRHKQLYSVHPFISKGFYYLSLETESTKDVKPILIWE